MDSWLKEAGDELDALDQGKPTKPQQRQKPPAKPPERGVEPPKEEAELEHVEPTEPEAPAEAAAAPAAEPKTINELRTAYSQQKKKVKEELEPTISRLQARVKELEETNTPEVKTLQERLAAAEKRRDELLEKVVMHDYTEDAEYQEKYQKPYVAAWQRALRDINQISVELPNGETRRATQADLERLANMELGDAQREAEARFGSLANVVMMHREKIIDLAEAQNFGAEQAKKRAMEKAQMSQVQSKEMSEKVKADIATASEAVVKRWPKMFGPQEEDPEGNKLWDKGIGLVDRLLDPTPETTAKTVEEAVALRAMVRAKAANHDRLALWLKKTRAELAQAKEELEQFRGSEPGGGLGGGPRGGATGDYMAEADRELEEMDRKSNL